MTIYTGPVFDWGASGLPSTAPEWNRPSPNLVAVERHLRSVFGGGSMGIHADRPIRGGTKLSAHAFGAALDWGFGPAQKAQIGEWGLPFGRVLTLDQADTVAEWIVAHSKELGVQHVMTTDRSWRSNRVDNGAGGWKPYRSGYTGHHHIETTRAAWADARPITDRLNPNPQPESETDMAPYIQLPPVELAGSPWFICGPSGARVATAHDGTLGLDRVQDTTPGRIERYDLLHESVLHRKAIL